MTTSLSNRDAPWDVRAIDAFWRDVDSPKLTLQVPPVVGVDYSLQLTNSTVKNGDVIDILYEHPSQFYNGYETLEELNRILICTGIISAAGSITHTDDIYKDSLQDIDFSVTSTASFSRFNTFKQTKIMDQSWGSEFLSGDFYVYIDQIGEYILLRWDSEGYAGDECIIHQSNLGYRAIYLSGYFFGDANWVRAGNLIPPPKFVDRLSDRLLKMGHELSWSGKKL
jgi:hypothetical protein